MKSHTLIVLMLTALGGCTTYQGYPALVPLPVGSGPGVMSTTGVTVTPITVWTTGGGRASYTVITPTR